MARQFTDSMTGATTERPGLQRMLTEARAGGFDVLLVYRVDRFSRSVRGLAQLLDECDKAGVAFRSATEPFDSTTAAGRMMVHSRRVRRVRAGHHGRQGHRRPGAQRPGAAPAIALPVGTP